jgi:septum formation protein
MRTIVLASASPRRADLLRQVGLDFVIDPSSVPEELYSMTEPAALASRLSLEKARDVARRHRGDVVISADTIGVLDGKVLGKPHTAVEARRMLAELSGRTHLVITGYTVLDTRTGKTITRAEETKVKFKMLTSTQIEAYVATGEPLDKAGAYAIQWKGALLVETINGDYYNVVGLPLRAMADALFELGVQVL